MKDYIIDLIENYVSGYNKYFFWEKPIVGFANANDKDFKRLKKIISPSHLTPDEVLSSAKTIIVYFIPFKKEIVKSNNINRNSSKEWALAYIETNKLIENINLSLKEELNQKGYETFLIPPTHNFDEESLISDWSHKHVAYIAGLGRFGLHKMLITEHGCCGRLGSIITSVKIKPSKKKSDEYCLYFLNKSCKKCIDNCIFGAIGLESFNRRKCYEICLENAENFKDYGLADVCGKCACNVPCSSKNPIKMK